jgi:GTP diphosphokinase / guanosine-3',5'-bis(diphosphate) 3'-diphosphatase
VSQLEEICARIQSYYPSPNLQPIIEAFNFSQKAHEGQVRATGEPFFFHLESVALLACQLKLDIPSIVAALLHDCLEDTDTDRATLVEKFGEEVTHIVDGVTKLTRIEFDSREEKQAESFRKMLIAMAKDIRVILVKLCDRLHNMRTLGNFSSEKQRRISLETKDIYAPLANRLGIHWLKSELEDLCLLFMRPEIHNLIREQFDRTAPIDSRNAFTKWCICIGCWPFKTLFINLAEDGAVQSFI